MATDHETPDPSELPDDPTRTAADAAGAAPQSSNEDDGPETERLDEDPAYGFDEPESELKGG